MHTSMMKKPEENNTTATAPGDFSEFMWMAEEGAEEGLKQQVSQSCQKTRERDIYLLLLC